MKQNNEVRTFIEEMKLIKDSLTNEWEGMTEEQIICLQEEVADIQDAIKRLLNKQRHDN
jgi:hypothetical protein